MLSAVDGDSVYAIQLSMFAFVRQWYFFSSVFFQPKIKGFLNL